MATKKRPLSQPNFDLSTAPFGFQTERPAIKHACQYCGVFPAKDAPLMVCAMGRYNTRILVCVDCRENETRYCAHENIWTDSAIGLQDAQIWVTPEYAHGRCYFVLGRNQWFQDSANAARALAQASAPAASIFGYHEAQPTGVHGWPSETLDYELCFGVELEMEHKHNTAEGRGILTAALGSRDGSQLPNHPGKYILARDGSLDQTGVELITSPYTLAFHQDQFGWRTVLDAAIHGGAQSGIGTNRCGMHVHCNRAAISALTLGKVLVFINSAGNSKLVDFVAQRTSSFAKKSLKGIRDGKVMRGGEKYEAVNVTDKTIEFRIFRGNLRVERVLKNIEFCHAVITYCSTASIKACSGHVDFIEWLCKNRGAYRNLMRFLAPKYKFKLTMPDLSQDL